MYIYDVFEFQYIVKHVDEQKFAEVLGQEAGQLISETEQQSKKLVLQYGGKGKAILLNNIYSMVSGNIKYYAKIGNLEEELARQYGEIEDYVRRMKEIMEELEQKYVTRNVVMDVIINDKYYKGEKSGLRFDADF